MKNKLCSDCKRRRLLKFFYKNSSRSSGVSYICKDCQLRRSARWAKANPDKVKKTKRKYRANNLESYRHYNLSVYWSNPVVMRARSAAARKAKGREHNRWQTIFQSYGITKEDWCALFKRQGQKCAVCKRKTPDTKRGWHTDHDHETGKVRGILCSRCNTVCGADTVTGLARLRAAVIYLERFE